MSNAFFVLPPRVLAFAALVTFAGPAPAAEMAFGGYLTPSGDASAGPVLAVQGLSVRGAGAEQPAGLGFSFTPRFGVTTLAGERGARLGAPALRSLAAGPVGGRAAEARSVSLSGVVGGYDLGLRTSASLIEQGGTLATSGRVYDVTGAFDVSGFEIGAGFQRTETPFTAGDVLSAGFAYDLGALTTRVGLQRLTPDYGVDSTVDVYSFGADLTLRPGVVVQGGLALSNPSDDEDEGATTGLVGLRFNF